MNDLKTTVLKADHRLKELLAEVPFDKATKILHDFDLVKKIALDLLETKTKGKK